MARNKLGQGHHHLPTSNIQHPTSSSSSSLQLQSIQHSFTRCERRPLDGFLSFILSPSFYSLFSFLPSFLPSFHHLLPRLLKERKTKESRKKALLGNTSLRSFNQLFSFHLFIHLLTGHCNLLFYIAALDSSSSP